jgi:8-oxo-dGTP diphosphatase
MNVTTRAIIVNADGKVLIGKRARGDAAGKWALIGGRLEFGETTEKAIIREVNEELGLLFHPTFWMEEIDTTSIPGETWQVYYFQGHGEGELSVKEDELEKVLFVGLDELDTLDIAWNHKDILIKFFEGY